MKILGLEFSSDERSVALGEVSKDETRLIESSSEPGPRGSTGMALIDRLLQKANVAPAEIQIIAVGLGPGSYAGIRSAIALAQGWQLARNVRLLGISSADVLAKEAQMRGQFGEVTILIDAQRSEFYAARYVISESGIQGGALSVVRTEEIRSERVIRPGELVPSAVTLIQLAGERTNYVQGEKLEPLYLREISFVKAAPPRFI